MPSKTRSNIIVKQYSVDVYFEKKKIGLLRQIAEDAGTTLGTFLNQIIAEQLGAGLRTPAKERFKLKLAPDAQQLLRKEANLSRVYQTEAISACLENYLNEIGE